MSSRHKVEPSSIECYSDCNSVVLPLLVTTNLYHALQEVTLMSRMPSNRRSQSFVEFSLIIILLSIVLLSILLILGDSIRTVINDLLGSWFPA